MKMINATYGKTFLIAAILSLMKAISKESLLTCEEFDDGWKQPCSSD